MSLSRSALRTWGMLFVVLGVAGRCIVQNTVLGVDGLTGQQMMDAMNDPAIMGYATVALVLEALYTCAAPLFAFLLVEGFCHTSHFRNYLLRVLGLAVLSELPYNLAMGGGWLVWDSRNPVFALAVCLVMLYFYRRYSEKGAKNLAVKAAVTLAAILWMSMLRVDEGVCLALLVAVLWAVRDRTTYRAIIGSTAALVCTLVSPFYLLAPVSMLVIHFYNGEKGDENRIVSYLSYPVILAAIAALAYFAM